MEQLTGNERRWIVATKKRKPLPSISRPTVYLVREWAMFGAIYALVVGHQAPTITPDRMWRPDSVHDGIHYIPGEVWESVVPPGPLHLKPGGGPVEVKLVQVVAKGKR